MIRDDGAKCQGEGGSSQLSAVSGQLPSFARLDGRGRPSLRGSSLLADRGVAQDFAALEIDLAGDQAIVVDAAGRRVFRAGIDDVLEGSVFVEETEGVLCREMVADYDTGVVHSRQSRAVWRVRVIDGGKSAVLPEETVAERTAGIGSDDRSVVIDGLGVGCLGLGISDGGVAAVDEAESLGYRFAVAEAADHVSQLVDVEHPGVRGLGIVDDGELVALPQESMNVPRVS